MAGAASGAHVERVDELTRGHRARAGGGIPHPVEDFLFTYYTLRPGQLRRWYPGAGVALADAPERAGWRFHRVVPAAGEQTGPTVFVDMPAFLLARGAQVAFTRRLLTATVSASGQFGCFGLHEWAMVFRQDEAQAALGRPLRLGQAAPTRWSVTHQIRCTHYDAFRFFTPPARPRNMLQPDLASGPSWSSRAACTPPWTSTSGPTS